MVAGLTTFMENKKICRDCFYEIDIKEEIERFKRTFPRRKPKIVFDIMACISMFLNGGMCNLLTGGRHKFFSLCVFNFCKNLKDLDAELYFFGDGPIKRNKIPTFIKGSNETSVAYKEYFKELNENEEEICLETGFQLGMYMNQFIETCSNFGKVFISVENECDIDLAKYATEIDAFAVVTIDSDFLIFPGDWQIWHTRNFDWMNLKTFVWSKSKLRKNLRLRENQMSIFATLSGNDFVPFKCVEYFHQQMFNMGHNCKQKALANYIIKEFPKGVPLTKIEFYKIVDIVYNKGLNNIEFENAKKLVLISLDFYDYNKALNPEIEMWLKKYINVTKSGHLYAILNNFILTINHQFVDFSLSEFLPYSQLVLPIIRRHMGIVLDHQREQNPEREICFKPSLEELFQVKKFTPIYFDYDEPEKRIPKLPDLYYIPIVTKNSAEIEHVIELEEKLRLLAWTWSNKLEYQINLKFLLENYKNRLLIPIICINYLVKEKQITIDEADILLLSINKSSKMRALDLMDLEPPKRSSRRYFWIGNSYNLLYNVCINSFNICGLYFLTKMNEFDGLVFLETMETFTAQDENGKVDLLKDIEHCRVYATNENT